MIDLIGTNFICCQYIYIPAAKTNWNLETVVSKFEISTAQSYSDDAKYLKQKLWLHTEVALKINSHLGMCSGFN